MDQLKEVFVSFLEILQHLQKELGIPGACFSLWVDWSLETPTFCLDCKELGF